MPDFIAWGDPAAAALKRELETSSRCYCASSCSSSGQRASSLCRSDRASGSAAKASRCLLAAEQIKPLARDQPEPGITGNRDAARQIDRVVAAELGTVNLGMGDKGGAVALVAKAPDDAGLDGLELRQAELGAGIGEIGHRVVTLDGQAGEAVGHDALGGRGPGRKARQRRQLAQA